MLIEPVNSARSPPRYDRRKVAFAVEHHHRMVSAIEDIDIGRCCRPHPPTSLNDSHQAASPVGIDLISKSPLPTIIDTFLLVTVSVCPSMKRKLGVRANEENIDSEIKRKARGLGLVPVW